MQIFTPSDFVFKFDLKLGYLNYSHNVGNTWHLFGIWDQEISILHLQFYPLGCPQPAMHSLS